MGKISGSRILRSRPNTMLGRWRGSWGLRGRGGGGGIKCELTIGQTRRKMLSVVVPMSVEVTWPLSGWWRRRPLLALQHVDDVQTVDALQSRVQALHCSERRHVEEEVRHTRTKRPRGRRGRKSKKEKKNRKTGGREKKNNFQPKVMTFSFQWERHWLWNWFWQVLGQRFSTGGLWSCSDWATASWTVSILFK